MNLILNRINFDPYGVLGFLCDPEQDRNLWYTLEHSYELRPKVPEGLYKCVRGLHTLKSGPIETFEVTNVPGHKGILFHPGNTENDSEGCILLGMAAIGVKLVSSRKAFDNFMILQSSVNDFILRVVHHE